MTENKSRKKKLRSGFTTGAAAAAAAKGAMVALLEKRFPEDVAVGFLNGEKQRIRIFECRLDGPGKAICSVVKDAGDDPDVTNGALIGVRATFLPNRGERTNAVKISGGEGVGVVTKPGLEVPPGDPAINSGPKKMIRACVKEILRRNGKDFRVEIEIFVPDGEKLAEKTLNKKLGILGGVSILGTTGIVRPMSHEAYTATIFSALSVAQAAGVKKIVFSTGRRSERCAQKIIPELPPEAFVQIGDFFSEALHFAAGCNFQRVIMAVFFGKALKMALGAACTHARKTGLSLRALAQWCLDDGGSVKLAGRIAEANTAREAFTFIREQRPIMVQRVGERLVKAAKKFSENRLDIEAIIFDFNEETAWRTQWNSALS